MGEDSLVSEAVASDLGSRRYTSMVDLDLSSKLTHLPEWIPGHAEIIFARDLGLRTQTSRTSS